MTHASAVSPPGQSTSDVIVGLAESTTSDRLSVGDLLDILEDRAFGIILLILALPCAVPFVYGVPQVLSVPLLFVAAQMILGRHKPWLPQGLRRRSFSTAAFRDMAHKAQPYLKWLEVVSRPRLSWLSQGAPERLMGLFIFLFSLSIAIPLPLTNSVPGVAVGVMALGFVERDGLMIVAGTVLGSAWIALLVTLAGGVLTLLEQALNWLV